jgi:hypothetical protein
MLDRAYKRMLRQPRRAGWSSASHSLLLDLICRFVNLEVGAAVVGRIVKAIIAGQNERRHVRVHWG